MTNMCYSLLNNIGGSGFRTHYIFFSNIAVKVPCEWSEWEIKHCSRSCGSGTREKTRFKKVKEKNGGSCGNLRKLKEPCNTHVCPGKFLSVFTSYKQIKLVHTSNSQQKKYSCDLHKVLAAPDPVNPTTSPNSETSSTTNMPNTVASTSIHSTNPDPGTLYSYVCAAKTYI